MKILHVSPSYYPAFKFGGPIQSVHQLNKELFNQGVNIDVVSTNAGLQDNKDISTQTWNQIDQLKVRFFKFIGYEHYNFSILMLFWLFKNVSKYDLVHVTAVWNFPVWATFLACKWHKIPYVISPRGTIYPETIAMKSANLKMIFYLLFAKSSLNNASYIHFTSIDEEIRVMEYLRLTPKSIVIPNGLEIPIVIENNELNNQLISIVGHQPYILFLGRINHKKGLDILIDAFAKVCQSNNDIQLILAGHDNDHYRLELEKQIDILNIKSRIKFVGPITGDLKWLMYHKSLFFVLTSYSENFGMSVVEAMLCKTPVLITDMVAISKDIDNNNAGIVVKTNPENIAIGLIKLINDHQLRSELSQKGYDFAKNNYQIESVAKKMSAFYQSIILK